MKSNSARRCKGRVAGVLLLALLPALVPAADGPDWWVERGMIDTNATPNDYAAVNLGQLKWFATNAYDELEANLSGGAGTNIEALVSGFGLGTNHVLVNLGQLKYVASLYYDRLIAEGQTNQYPWAGAAQTNDYTVANIGQMKYLFSFVLDGATGGVAFAVNSGTISYSGGQNGTILVLAATSSDSWATNRSTSLASPGAYTIADIPTGSNYWAKAWRDSDSDGAKDAAEAWGTYAGNPIYLTTDVSGANITLTDPDDDSDGLADWVETGTGIYAGPTDTGTSSSTNDTDGDGILDGTEVDNRTDPNNSDTNAPTIVIAFPTNGYKVVWMP